MRQKRHTSVIAVTYGRSAPKKWTFSLEGVDVRTQKPTASDVTTHLILS